MRAREPDTTGFAESHGVPIHWETHGEGERTVMLVAGWQLCHSRMWKMQVAYLARYFRVVVYDLPGNGRSGRPASGYDYDRSAEDLLSVLDATGTGRASLVCHSRGAWPGVIAAARHVERVERLVLVDPALFWVPADRDKVRARFDDVAVQPQGWEKYNAHYWRAHYADFLEFFAGRVFSEPTRRPFLYFPLRFHRLDRYGAGTRMDYHRTDPEALAHAVADGLKRPALCCDVETDGARRAAALIAPLI